MLNQTGPISQQQIRKAVSLITNHVLSVLRVTGTEGEPTDVQDSADIIEKTK